jgi:hypothetical protein
MATHATLQKGQATVNIKMLFLVRHLVKLHFAAFNWAEKRLLERVNSKMIEEIVPFAEETSTSVIVARENF